MLAEHFGEMTALQAADEQTLQINEVGEITAKSVYEWLHSEHGEKIIADLAELGINMQAEKKTLPAGGGKLAGKSLVVTGTLQKYKRDEIETLILEHGGKAASSVSKKTDYLIAGEEAGSKLTKAQQLGVKIITEAEFDALLQAE